ncbi:snurportin-1 protein, partial [Perilla frutescens var. frutescens]
MVISEQLISCPSSGFIVDTVLHSFCRPSPYSLKWRISCNLHAHYESGNTPLVLVWKDENCSQYVLDTDSKGHIPDQQQVVLELLDDGRLATLDDPSVIFGCLDSDFIQK